MKTEHFSASKQSVVTQSGRISYSEAGTGPVALFVHGVLLNGHLWRHQLSQLSDTRRCIAVDLLAHGDTEISPEQDVSVTANATMLREFLNVLQIDQVDLVGNYSGGGIAQIFAAQNPSCVHSLTPTDCDVHDNWPPAAFKPFLAMSAAGGLRDALNDMLNDKNSYRSPQALGAAYEHPELVSDETIRSVSAPAGQYRATNEGCTTLPCRIRLQTHHGCRGAIKRAKLAYAHRMANGRRIFRREVVALAG